MNPLTVIRESATSSGEFLSECWSELKKVHWPTRKETRAATIVVIIGVIIVGAYLGVIDLLLAKVVEWAFK